MPPDLAKTSQNPILEAARLHTQPSSAEMFAGACACCPLPRATLAAAASTAGILMRAGQSLSQPPLGRFGRG